MSFNYDDSISFTLTLRHSRTDHVPTWEISITAVVKDSQTHTQETTKLMRIGNRLNSAQNQPLARTNVKSRLINNGRSSSCRRTAFATHSHRELSIVPGVQDTPVQRPKLCAVRNIANIARSILVRFVTTSTVFFLYFLYAHIKCLLLAIKCFGASACLQQLVVSGEPRRTGQVGNHSQRRRRSL